MKAAAFLFLVLAACRTTDDADPTPKAHAAPQLEPQHSAAYVQAPPALPAVPIPVMPIGRKASGVELVDPPPGDVAAVVRTARAEAQAHGRTLLVYIGATWCEPCQHFHHAAERGELDASFPKLTLLTFDADRDGDRLRAASYAPGYIPYFGWPGPDGRGTGNGIEGSVKGEGAVDNIAPRLHELIAKNEH